MTEKLFTGTLNHNQNKKTKQNDRMTDRLKTVYPRKTRFCGGYKHVHVENQVTPPHIFHLEQLSASSGVQEYRGMYSLFNAEGSLMRV